MAEALFKTVEPGADSGATLLHRLGRDLDASELLAVRRPDDPGGVQGRLRGDSSRA